MIGIGLLSKATGVPEPTLRTWERRYGVPRSVRKPSGHRLYPTESVAHLKLAVRAMGRGLRASRALLLSPEQLRHLLVETFVSAVPNESDALWIAGCLDGLTQGDGASITARLRVEWNRRGTLRVLSELVGPLLVEIGDRWERGTLSVWQEHLASEQLRGYLSGVWGLLNAGLTLRVCLATLPEERHDLGLHMAASVITIQSVGVVFLGQGAPITDILQASQGIDAVVLSVSSAMAASVSRGWITQLRATMDPSQALVCGGTGAPTGVDGVRHLPSLEALSEWALELQAG